jgi:hypothetical protein
VPAEPPIVGSDRRRLRAPGGSRRLSFPDVGAWLSPKLSVQIRSPCVRALIRLMYVRADGKKDQREVVHYGVEPGLDSAQAFKWPTYSRLTFSGMSAGVVQLDGSLVNGTPAAANAAVTNSEQMKLVSSPLPIATLPIH